jgi:hypothetical protein
MNPTFTAGLPPGIDGGALISYLVSAGGVVMAMVAAVGFFFLVAAILKRAAR